MLSLGIPDLKQITSLRFSHLYEYVEIPRRVRHLGERLAHQSRQTVATTILLSSLHDNLVVQGSSNLPRVTASKKVARFSKECYHLAKSLIFLCISSFLGKNKRISIQPTSQQRKSAKALWKVPCIRKESFTRQNPPKNSTWLRSALHPGKTGQWIQNELSVTYLCPCGPEYCIAKERDALLPPGLSTKGRGRASLPSAAPRSEICLFSSVYGTSVMHQHLPGARERPLRPHPCLQGIRKKNKL